MYDIDSLSAEARLLVNMLGGPKDATPTYKLNLVVEHHGFGKITHTTVVLDEEYKSVHNLNLMAREYQLMSIDDIKWCLGDYPTQGDIREVVSVTTKIVLM